MYKVARTILFFTVIMACSSARKNIQTADPVKIADINRLYSDAAEQLMVLKKQLPADALPRSLDSTGHIVTCNSSNWVSGFYIGSLCFLYETLKDTALLNEAEKRSQLLAKEQYNTNTHDLGFMMYCSYGNLYKIHPTPERKQILLNSARSLASRFNPKVGCIRSWGKPDDTDQFRVIIDNMMNLELLLWAFRETADSAFYKIAVTHANTTMVNHYRPDHSSCHLVIYDPATGAVRKKQTVQGYSDGSSWARGQSWGLYGYTMMYRETGDNRYLEQANRIAGFLLSHPHLPSDKIPYWDYDSPDIPNTYRDASAASLMASALLELAEYNTGQVAERYRTTAKQILATLSSPVYRATKGENGGFILRHCVGHLPARSEIDKPLSYADYYYLEALQRLHNMKTR